MRPQPVIDSFIKSAEKSSVARVQIRDFILESLIQFERSKMSDIMESTIVDLISIFTIIQVAKSPMIDVVAGEKAEIIFLDTFKEHLMKIVQGITENEAKVHAAVQFNYTKVSIPTDFLKTIARRVAESYVEMKDCERIARQTITSV